MVESSSIAKQQGFIQKPKPPSKFEHPKVEKSAFEVFKERAYQVAEAITEAIDESMGQMPGMPLGFAATVATGTSSPSLHLKKDPKLNEEQLQLSKQIETMVTDVQTKTSSMLHKFAKDQPKGITSGLHVGEWLHDASETIAKTADKVLHPKEHHGHDVQHRNYLRGTTSGLSKA